MNWDTSALISTASGVVYVIIYYFTYSLGMYHDGQSGQCKAGDGYIMSPSTSGASKIHLWSPCSKAYLLDSIRYYIVLVQCTVGISSLFHVCQLEKTVSLV